MAKSRLIPNIITPIFMFILIVTFILFVRRDNVSYVNFGVTMLVMTSIIVGITSLVYGTRDYASDNKKLSLDIAANVLSAITLISMGVYMFATRD